MHLGFGWFWSWFNLGQCNLEMESVLIEQAWLFKNQMNSAKLDEALDWANSNKPQETNLADLESKLG